MLAFYLALAQDENDRDKFEQIYIKYRRLMLSAAYKILGDAELSEDAVHNAFMRILNNLGKLGEVDSPRTRSYVVIVAENVAKTMYMQRRRTVSLEDEELPGSVDDVASEYEDKSSAEYVAAVIARMPEKYGAVLILKYLNGLGDREIASSLGLSDAAVRKRLQRAREMLKTLLDVDDVEGF
jgi:RNA polymerase sigma-70 factor (ECF subfamily)